VKPLVVIGLDGATRSVIDLPGAKLPNLAAIRRDGASCVLRSTVPPITAAAWASMLTGWNPGRHGMYDFRRLRIDRYTRLWGAGHSAAFEDGRDFVTSRRWAGAAVWDLAKGRRVGILSVPMTFPPWPVEGELVAGFPLPDYGRNYAHPPSLAERLPPLLEGADRLKRLDDEHLAAHCLRLIEQQRDVVLEWLRDGRHDLVVAVFQGTDFAQHRLWKYLADENHPLRSALLDMYRVIDALVGEARELLGPEGTLAVVSDHGFGPHPRTFVRTDAVLAQAGLLAQSTPAASTQGSTIGFLRRAPAFRRALRLAANKLPDRLGELLAGRYTGASKVDWTRTIAYRIPLYAPAEGVAINLEGRQEQGIIEPGEEYEGARDQVIAALLALEDPAGRKPVVWARRREEVYQGPYLEEAPDVVVLFDPDFKGSSGLGNVFDPVPESILAEYSGVHAMEGIFAVAGPGVRPGIDLGVREIVDVSPTLLALISAPIPADIDGRAMTEALVERPEMASAADGRVLVPDEDFKLSAEEKVTLAQSLRALGYLE
jgi:predicted AlkP superfamily phosphohydrolase/phosphomutase